MRRDDWLIHQLPVAMAEDDLLVRFVTIFQCIGDTLLHQIDTLPYQFDPTVAPPTMVRTMAAWVGLDWVDSSLDERLQREAVLRYSELLQWRGTRRGLTALLELLTQGPVEVTDSGGVYPEGEAPGGPPHITVRVASSGFVSAGDLVRIVRDEIPANATLRVSIADEVVWPPPDRSLAATGSLPQRQMESDDA